MLIACCLVSCIVQVEAKTDKLPESKPEASAKPTDLDPELADIDLDDPELTKAATKIQAGFRGHAARKQLPPKSTEVCTHAIVNNSMWPAKADLHMVQKTALLLRTMSWFKIQLAETGHCETAYIHVI